MSIRSKLILSTVIEIILVALVAVVLAAILQAVNRANDKSARIFKVNEAITELRFLTFENMLNHDDRSLQQWQAKYQSLETMLAPQPGDLPAERQILAAMADQNQQVKLLFDRLVDSYAPAASGQTEPVVNDIQQRLVGQLLVKQQTQITDASQLAALGRVNVATEQTRYFWIALGVVLLMLLVTAVNAWAIIAGISSSLSSLQKGAAAFAAGNLGYQIRHRQNDELGRLAAAFNAMASSLKRIDQTKAEFIMMASHQLRTPATAVKGFMSLLAEGYMGKLSPKQTDAVKSALFENERELSLVDEMLAVAQAETGEMTLTKTPTDLAALIGDVVVAQLLVAGNRFQQIRYNPPTSLPLLAVDAEKFRMVLENLITNASLYSPLHTTIEVSLRLQAAQIVVEVKDQGYGIAKQDLPKLFKKFSRLSNTGETRIDGAGLGLFLAKKLVDLHGGTISVSSTLAKGSTFTVRLPQA